MNFNEITRRKSRQIMVGNVPVGGSAPVSVQSMTNTDTEDTAATLAQIRAIAAAGADIVRVSVPSMRAAEAFRKIRAGSPIPVVADIHFDYRIALRVAEYGADCLRINPGNIGSRERTIGHIVFIVGVERAIAHEHKSSAPPTQAIDSLSVNNTTIMGIGNVV